MGMPQISIRFSELAKSVLHLTLNFMKIFGRSQQNHQSKM